MRILQHPDLVDLPHGGFAFASDFTFILIYINISIRVTITRYSPRKLGECARRFICEMMECYCTFL